MSGQASLKRTSEKAVMESFVLYGKKWVPAPGDDSRLEPGFIPAL